MDAENTYQVLPWMWTSGQLSAEDIRRLPAMKIEVVFNLAPPTSSNALVGEGELISGLGMTYVQIPVNWEAPTVDQFRQYVGLLEVFVGRNVWVHCAKNMRVSVFTFLYRKLIRNDDAATASFPMREIWVPNPIWHAFIDEVCAAYADQHPCP